MTKTDKRVLDRMRLHTEKLVNKVARIMSRKISWGRMLWSTLRSARRAQKEDGSSDKADASDKTDSSDDSSGNSSSTSTETEDGSISDDSSSSAETEDGSAAMDEDEEGGKDDDDDDDSAASDHNASARATVGGGSNDVNEEEEDLDSLCDFLLQLQQDAPVRARQKPGERKARREHERHAAELSLLDVAQSHAHLTRRRQLDDPGLVRTPNIKGCVLVCNVTNTDVERFLVDALDAALYVASKGRCRVKWR